MGLEAPLLVTGEPFLGQAEARPVVRPPLVLAVWPTTCGIAQYSPMNGARPNSAYTRG